MLEGLQKGTSRTSYGDQTSGEEEIITRSKRENVMKLKVGGRTIVQGVTRFGRKGWWDNWRMRETEIRRYLPVDSQGTTLRNSDGVRGTD